MQYVKTQFVDNAVKANWSKVKPGQWVQNSIGQRGQFMGIVSGGVPAFNWLKPGESFNRKVAKANKPLRAFVRVR